MCDPFNCPFYVKVDEKTEIPGQCLKCIWVTRGN